jgi:anaerobic magnesium-protoporphyrin IX monomethyl ester cyclase
MKAILVSINAKYIHTNNAVRLLKANSDFDIKILEFTIKDDIEYIINSIEEEKADVIGLSVYIWNANIFNSLINRLDKNKSKIVLGGPEVSYDAMKLIENKNIDFILKGEAEFTFTDLLNKLAKGNSPENVDGITFIKNGNIINNPIKEIKDLSNIKSPHFFESDIEHIPNKIAYIESSRGCPYKCSYCLSSLEKSVRFFDIETVKNEINYIMSKGTKTIKFLDRTFNANKNTFDLFDYIISINNNRTVFQFEITGDTLDRSIIEHLNNKAPKGLIRFEIGIQSTNKETNLLVDRYQNNQVLFDNIRLIQEGNVIDLHLDLIAGLPKENKESFIKTFNDVFSLGALELQLGFLKMLKGTKIRREANKYGYIYNELAPYEIIENDCLSKSDIDEIKQVEEMLDIYHNKGYFGENLLNYILMQKSHYEFFLGIAKEYQIHNYSLKGYQIHEIYERILSFINIDDVNDKVKIDYLLRSKIKPKIFWDNNITKQTKRLIFENLSNNHSYNLNELFKHSVVIKVEENFHVFYYKNLISNQIIVKKKDITI